jgi:hypothetical protein
MKEALNRANSTFRLNDGIQADYPEWYADVYLPTLSEIFSAKITGKQFQAKLRDETIKFWAKKSK